MCNIQQSSVGGNPSALMELDNGVEVLSCGMKLRSDDPAAMKDFILSVQNRVNELKSTSGDALDNKLKINNKRMKFMLETILDIKNNKKKSTDDSAKHTQIKKWLQKLGVDQILLRGLKWNKLLDPSKKDHWWLYEDTAPTTDDVEVFATKIDREVTEAQKLLQLATTQRMNTDIRRAIFCIIMSGEDYLDSFEKLRSLDLPGKQDREIIRVLLDCCLQEKVFNKYYTILASKLCSHDKSQKITLKYCLWDRFKEIESMELIKSKNLARFISEMLVSFSLSLAVLKTVGLSNLKELTPKKIMHFRMLFEDIFKNTDAVVWNIFTRVAVDPDLEILRDGLVFFIKQYVVNTNDKTISEKFKIAKEALKNMEEILR
ncbi:hypothetical protein GIB67_034185 [Kingdonia uniflora]|uniref:MI domain-containing protein n=1 Tax=Kingdonia uniflora TaxID=39325 RepID=A0A7J7NRS1_9MAGN|nr:hypothetical protein GIB67_034185 [Kingdonia uniflora]